jgi:hypothetical protein
MLNVDVLMFVVYHFMPNVDIQMLNADVLTLVVDDFIFVVEQNLTTQI